MKKIKILDIPFDIYTIDDALARIFHTFDSKQEILQQKHIVTPNPEMLLEAQKNPDFKRALQGAFMSIPDGTGILWAATLENGSKRTGKFIRILKGLFYLLAGLFSPSKLRKIIPQRVTGVDLMEKMCAEAARRKVPIFLLGAAPGVAQKTAEKLEQKYKGLKIVGVTSLSPFDEDFASIYSQIEETHPQILFVAFGSPAQELWLHKHLKKLRSVKIAIGVGGAFDFISNTKNRAPKWMQHIGIEWLFRLFQEPSRIKRIWNAVVIFSFYVLFFRVPLQSKDEHDQQSSKRD